MKIRNWTLYTTVLLLTSCFYAKVKINKYDKAFIPYLKSNQLIFSNANNINDTVYLKKHLPKKTNLDFYIDKNLGKTNDSKKPYYESYSTDFSRNHTSAESYTSRPHIMYSQFIFSFNKYQADSLIGLYYSFDDYWYGNMRFDKEQLDTIILNGRVYPDVITVKNDSNKYSEIDKMYWSIKFGLIKFEEKNGEQWSLVDIILKNK